jgi:hypothetical protein
MEATELIAELADALYTLVPTCFCHAKHCSQCANWERAKKLVDAAGVFANSGRRGSDGKKPPQGGSVNTPRPPQHPDATNAKQSTPDRKPPKGGTGTTPPEKKVCRFIYRGKGKFDPIPEDAFSDVLADQLADKPESLIACDGCGVMYSLKDIAILNLEETLCGMCWHTQQRNKEQKCSQPQ